MTEPRWLTLQMVATLHEESLARFGGTPGLRDEGLLDSALARPRQIYAYAADPTMARLAAAYGSGIVRNHPFVDGNKRAALLAVAVFLRLNGYELDPDEADEVTTILALAAGDLTDEELAAWIEKNSRVSG